MSGWLEDATTDADLDEAIKHGLALFNAGIVDGKLVQRELAAVLRAVMQWGDATIGANSAN